jgi:hypothetical protein
MIKQFSTLTEAVNFLTAELQVSRQKATHLVWDFETTIGTDRSIWLDMNRVVKAI